MNESPTTRREADEVPLVDTATITVGYDGSDTSAAAVRWAGSEALHRGGIVRVLACVDGQVEPTTDRLLPDPRPVYEMAEWLMQSQTSTEPRPCVEFAFSVLWGPAEQRLVNASSGSALLVIGSAGHQLLGAWRLGAITHEVLRHATCPVVLVPAGHIPGWQGRIVVGVEDHSSTSALSWAAAEASRRNAELVIVHVRQANEVDGRGGHRPASAIVAEAAGLAAQRCNTRIETRIVDGQAAPSLLAQGSNADMLVVGTRSAGHGDGKPGSTARAIGACATCPTVIVQPGPPNPPRRHSRVERPCQPSPIVGRINQTTTQRGRGVRMFEKLVVPVDLSPDAFDAMPIAARLAAQVAGTVEVVNVVDTLAAVAPARDALAAAVERLGPQPAEVTTSVLADRSVAGALTRHIESDPRSMLLLRSHGHGRSAGIIGGTVDEVLRAMFGPLIVVGPQAVASHTPLDGSYVVPVDGSARAKGVIPIVAAWAVEFGGTPCLVEVVDNRHGIEDDIESSYVRAQATRLERRIGRRIDFEILHGADAARPIVDFAAANDASFIFMATHGRTGFDRLRMGSVAADVVRHAPMPVVLFRPPNYLRVNGSPAPVWAEAGS